MNCTEADALNYAAGKLAAACAALIQLIVKLVTLFLETPSKQLVVNVMMETTPHILIVDDNREIRDLLARFLRKHSMRVTPAADAADAKRVLKTSAIDLIVLDIMMPGEDGLAFTRHVRETADMPIILLTALTEETDRIVGLELGADDYVTKPFNPRELAPASRPCCAGRIAFRLRASRSWARSCVSAAGPSMPAGGKSSMAIRWLRRYRMANACY